MILPNAWDVASARIFEQAGFPAIATTSAGIANLFGYPDGERISRAEMLDMVARIARAVKIPVTADMEAGYGDAAETARGVIEAGAVGCNLEDADEDGPDGLMDVEAQCESLRAARAVADRMGIPLVINARTDVYLGSDIAPERRLEEALKRLRAYAGAGASSLFAPGVRDEATIRALAEGVPLPLNVLLTAGMPDIARLAELGVGRISIGSAGMRTVMGVTAEIARELRESGGTRTLLSPVAMSYGDANGLFE